MSFDQSQNVAELQGRRTARPNRVYLILILKKEFDGNLLQTHLVAADVRRLILKTLGAEKEERS